MRTACSLLALVLVGCGGSSSETPPPLEPDPTSFRYTGPRLPGVEPEAPAAPEPAAEVDEDDLPAGQKPKAAPATWGTGKPARGVSSAVPAPAAAPLPAPPSSASAPLPAAPAPQTPAPPPAAPGKN